MTYRLLLSEPGPGEGTRQSLEPEREKSLLRTLLGFLEEGDCPPLYCRGAEPPCWGLSTFVFRRTQSQGNRKNGKEWVGVPRHCLFAFSDFKASITEPVSTEEERVALKD